MVLRIVLIGKWFDMFLAGLKDEEYRDVTAYWMARLMERDGERFKQYKYVEARHGYAKNARVIHFRHLGTCLSLPTRGMCPDEYLGKVFFTIKGGTVYEGPAPCN